jgi:ammonium transporter, Amt family
MRQKTLSFLLGLGLSLGAWAQSPAPVTPTTPAPAVTTPAAEPVAAVAEAAKEAPLTAEQTTEKIKNLEARLGGVTDNADGGVFYWVSAGDTAWVLLCAALVLLMTLPGLALFYGGLVRKKNILSVLMQCLTACGIVSVFWVVCGYSLAFGEGNGLIGGFKWAMLTDLPAKTGYAATVPHLAFVVFQMMFAVITPALIAGAFAERMRFPAFCLFTLLWVAFIYCPIAHWVWSDSGFMSVWNANTGDKAAMFKAFDFAGGTVVHINAGVAALVCAIYLGKRKGFPNRISPPHNLPLAVVGACLLWVGWFGFNAGSSLAANGLAAHAMLTTHVATALAGMVWAGLDWMYHKKPTVLGMISGAVAGLVAITPACGFVTVKGALIVGLCASIASWFFVTIIKPKLNLDDTLDAFGVHGVSGIIGALLTGLLCSSVVNSALVPADISIASQFVSQLKAVVITASFTAVGTWIILVLVNCITKVRADEREETVGLDVSQHKESAYTVID